MKVKVPVAGTIGKVVVIDTNAGAQIGTNLRLPDGSIATLAQLQTLFAGAGSGAGVVAHSSLLGLQSGNDHPQYPLKTGAEAISGSWNFGALPSIGGVLLPEYIEDTIGGILADSSSINFTYGDTANQITANVITSWAPTWSGLHTFTNGIIANHIDIGEADTMVLNGGTIAAQLQINSDTLAIAEIHTHSSAGATFAPILYGARGRGTESVPVIVSNGDYLLRFVAVGYDGVDYAAGASIDFIVDGTPGSNDMPTAIVFSTTPDGAQVPVEALRIGSTKLVTLADGLTAAGVFLGPAGSVSAPTFAFSGDPNTGIYSIGADQFGITVGGANIVSLTTSGLTLTSAGSGFFTVSAANATTADLRMAQAGVNRWIFRKDGTAETGANVGSNFAIVARDDAGAGLFNVLTAVRATGIVTFPQGAVFSATSQFTTLEIGHATDTTLSRSGAGLLAVEGNIIPHVAYAPTWTATHTWTDNDEVCLGTGGDLRLFHDGTNSTIRNDTGELLLSMSGTRIARFLQSGAIYFGASTPAATPSFTNFETAIFFHRTSNPTMRGIAYGSTGSIAAPAALSSGDGLLIIGGGGYDGTAFSANVTARVLFQASEAWTDIAHGSKITFDVTANGTVGAAPTTAVKIENDGALQISNGAVGAPALSFLNNANMGFYRIGANNIGLATAGVLRFDVSTTLVNFAVATQHTTLEIGAATDTTLSRSGAGLLAVEGNIIPHVAYAATWTATHDFQKAAIGVTSTDGIILENPTASTAGVTKQWSPRLRLTGHAWKSNAVAADHTDDWIIENQTADHSATTTSALVFSSQIAGGGYSPRISMESDGRLYGNALHNNAGAVTGATNQYIASGTYTPTLTNTTNVAASTARLCSWMRVGNVVTVAGQLDVDITAAGATLIGISLPIASALTTAFQLGGTGAAPLTNMEAAAIDGDAANDRAQMRWVAVNTANHTMSFCFQYEVL